ncbi:MAG: hypothetical protein ACU85V_07445 [Gammaproteobacteria bacterium]
MANPVMHMSASAGDRSHAVEERLRAYSEASARVKGGLDTGRRGWRFLAPSAVARPLHGGHGGR